MNKYVAVSWGEDCFREFVGKTKSELTLSLVLEAVSEYEHENGLEFVMFDNAYFIFRKNSDA